MADKVPLGGILELRAPLEVIGSIYGEPKTISLKVRDSGGRVLLIREDADPKVVINCPLRPDITLGALAVEWKFRLEGREAIKVPGDSVWVEKPSRDYIDKLFADSGNRFLYDMSKSEWSSARNSLLGIAPKRDYTDRYTW